MKLPEPVGINTMGIFLYLQESRHIYSNIQNKKSPSKEARIEKLKKRDKIEF